MAGELTNADGFQGMKVFGTGSLHDFLGDAIAFRSLTPVDRGLPGLEDLRHGLGLVDSNMPRKVESAYALVVAEILRAANRALTGSSDVPAVVLLGDTEHNDGGAFLNICDVLSCPGGAFICDEQGEDPQMETTGHGGGRAISLANRWRLVEEFETKLAGSGVDIGEGTAVIVDIDKTALGARGRNHRPIDEARGAAVLRTARGLRDAVDGGLLMTAYDHFNHPRFHQFTTDNQDYLAYLALIVESGWRSLDILDGEISDGRWASFSELLSTVSKTTEDLHLEVRRVHSEVVAAVAAGDPTPFKEFRRCEFQETIGRMRLPGDDADIRHSLENTLTVTYEVWRKALQWRERGALLFGLSDKPDEASLPTADLAAQGYLPLHRTEALVVGEDVAAATT